jgi:opacity protein-like surface antigen
MVAAGMLAATTARLAHGERGNGKLWPIPNFFSNCFLAGAAATVVAASPVQAANTYALGVCRTASPSAGAEIRPTYDGDTYLYDYRSAHLPYKGFSLKEGAKVTLIKVPQHGEVALVNTPLGIAHNWYHYMPTDASYSGQDRFEVQVEKSGITIHIHYLMEVLDEYDTPTGRCHSGHWKISRPATPDSPDQSPRFPA